MTTLCSYDLNGKKLSFANWISNLSPQETPFTSMTGKESINQTLFQWQTDHLAAAGMNAQVEGDEALDGSLGTTQVKSNVTQILRKTVKVSDTANALANYGRGRELQYQMEKAGKEIKRDLEWVFLNNHSAVTTESPDGSGGVNPRRTAGFVGLVAGKDQKDIDTEAVVHKNTAASGTITEADLFGLTSNLYLAGSRADIIMFHPKHASFFSSLQEKATGTRVRIFESTPKFSVHVSTIVDPLGQEYKLIPNRWMPEGLVFFFNSSDWTQMVLRAPQRTKLAKDGSYEKWMIEMEVGLRHRNPFASGILDLIHDDDLDTNVETFKITYTNSAGVVQTDTDVKSGGVNLQAKSGTEIKVKYKFKAATGATAQGSDVSTLYLNGKEMGHWTANGTTADVEQLITARCGAIHNGSYYVTYRNQAGTVYAISKPVHIQVV